MSQQTLPATSAGSPGGGGGLPRRRRLGADMLFRGTATFAGSMVLIIIAAIAVFLVVKAIPAFQDDTENFFSGRGRARIAGRPGRRRRRGRGRMCGGAWRPRRQGIGPRSPGRRR